MSWKNKCYIVFGSFISNLLWTNATWKGILRVINVMSGALLKDRMKIKIILVQTVLNKAAEFLATAF